MKVKKMITIRDRKLFNELKNVENTDEQTIWNTQFVIPENDAPYLKNGNIPSFFGGLDHIKFTRKGIEFHDRGCNGKDNTYVIRPEQ